MKFTCEKAILVSGVSIASRTVSLKNSISALEGIYVRAGAHLEMTGYNMETGITVVVPANIRECGSCVFPAKLFGDIIRKLADDIVTITVDEKFKVSIDCGDSHFMITAQSADDYPELPEVESDKSIAVPQNKLKEMIAGTIFSVSDNQTRPIHTGCLFEINDDSVTVVAVDGYRFAMRRWHSGDSIGRTLKFVAPGAALKELEKILTDSEEPAFFTLGTKHLMFKVGDCTLICRLLEGEFLDWKRVVPTNCPIKLVCTVNRMLSTIDRVSLIISEKVKTPLRCCFGDNVAEFRTVSTIGTAKDQCLIAGDGKDLEIGFNCRYVMEALRAVPADEAMLNLNNNLSPMVITPVDGSDAFSYMVLPVRLKAGE